MSDLIVFWNHVGREHGGLEYTEDLQANSPHVRNWAMNLKERHAYEAKRPVKFIRHDENTLLELATSESARKFIIIYCLDLGLQFSLNFKTKYPWWVVDIVEFEEKKPGVYCAHDLLIDVAIGQDGGYQVLDLDEFEQAIGLGILTQEQIRHALRSLHGLCEQLNKGSFPDERIREIMEIYSVWSAQN